MKRILDQPKELIILTEHFAPSTGATAQLITDLADDLHFMGARLRVVTSTSGCADRPYPVLRLSSSRRSSVGILSKIADGLTFFVGSTIWLLLKCKNHQSLFIVSNPPFIGLIGVLLSIVKKTRYIFLLQDVFPRSATLTGVLPAQGPLLYFWRYLIKTVLQKSQSTVVLSSSMIRRCHSEFGTSTDLSSIANWAVLPPQTKSKYESLLAESWAVDSVFTIQYSGNFGRLHDILTILEAARLLKYEDVKFVFVGGGAKATQIHQYCTEYRLTNVSLIPYQPRSLLGDSLAACDIAVVSLIPGAEDTVAPSKFYGIIACSRPVILISNQQSELASTILDSQCGFVVAHGDVQTLRQKILDLKCNYSLAKQMSENARQLYEKEFGRTRSVSQYYQLLKYHQMI